MLRAYLWSDGRGFVALYPASPAAARPRPQSLAAAVSENGHALSGRGR